MKRYFIAPIAEGKGEVHALPRLLQRLYREVVPRGVIDVNPVIRVKAGSFLRDTEYFSRHVELAARKAKPHARSSVLILLDCEDDCPARVGPNLLRRAREVRSDVAITVALAHREYETWFLAAAESLRGKGGLPRDLEVPPNPEAIRGAKEWLGRLLPTGYHEVNHQALLTEHFSFEQAARIDSFKRLRLKLQSAFRA